MIPSDVRPDQPAGSASEITHTLAAAFVAIALAWPAPRILAQATPLRANPEPVRLALANSRLFLDVFRAQDEPIVTSGAEWETALGKQRGWLVRPKSTERLPALLLLAAGDARDFALQSAREMAGIGYVVLVVPLDDGASSGPQSIAAVARERHLARLAPAVRWLRSRDDVFAYKLGVLGWGAEARWALELAAACELQAAVLADGDLPHTLDVPLAFGLARTVLLIVRPTSESPAQPDPQSASLQNALTAAHIQHRQFDFKEARPGFMQSRRTPAEATAADHAWFEIYEFLGKHVEDAEPNSPTLARGPQSASSTTAPVVTIADVMRAINSPTGLRGQIARTVNEGPRTDKDWHLLRAQAAVITDAGTSLLNLTPPRGTATSWQHHATFYRDAAAELITAADDHNLPAARQALDRLNASCSRCHVDHR
ncbi:MAG TPA: dienelactone hydrolase family protein [Planctomycetaceae bacterium]|nr:dienelactone hydrolase family protein [Planctomycetaceae bacterium]